MSDFWLALGFRANPYAVRPLPSNENGRRLLVGRDEDLADLKRRIANSDVHPALEGSNGVGKTSLVSVAAYELLSDFQTGRAQQLFLTLGEPLQMKDDGAELVREVYFAIAQAFIEHYDTLRAAGRHVPDLDEVRTWLNSPTYRSAKGGGFNSPVGGVTGSTGTGLNTSGGFAESGFPHTVRQWLRTAFPENSGGFVGTLDNLELLDTSANAQKVLEQVRDPVLQLPGMRWVLCGARGIARSLATTPRLNGVLSDPIEMLPVGDQHIEELVRQRVVVFSVDDQAPANAPVNATAFGYLYDVSHQNLRDSLKYAQDFALGKDPSFFLDNSSHEIEEELMRWVDDLAERNAADVRLQPRMWKLLEDLAVAGGTASPGDHLEFGFNDRTHMRKNVVELERFSLADSSKDEVDGRRRSIALTSKGWLVHFAKKNDLLGQRAIDFDTPRD